MTGIRKITLKSIKKNMQQKYRWSKKKTCFTGGNSLKFFVGVPYLYIRLKTYASSKLCMNIVYFGLGENRISKEKTKEIQKKTYKE